MTDDPRDLAIMRKETHKWLAYIESRLEFVDRDIRRAANDFEKAKLEYGRKELDRWRARLRTEIAALAQRFGGAS